MAKVKGPLMSMEAHGTYGGQVRFRRGPGGVHVYTGGEPHSKGPKRVSAAQQAQRDSYRAAVAQWRELSESARLLWSQRGRVAGLTAYSAFLSFTLGGGSLIVDATMYPSEGVSVGLEAAVLVEDPGEIAIVW